mmetsp:Transcript_4777/g.6817  ORF Transcript_4777/g.6817 Transcript_4777/m.6817 type:complete len:84 (-) Transcript_4777:46-297(-)
MHMNTPTAMPRGSNNSSTYPRTASARILSSLASSLPTTINAQILSAPAGSQQISNLLEEGIEEMLRNECILLLTTMTMVHLHQ